MRDTSPESRLIKRIVVVVQLVLALANLRQQGIAPHPYLWAGFMTAGDWR